jgi:hypothetical protein
MRSIRKFGAISWWTVVLQDHQPTSIFSRGLPTITRNFNFLLHLFFILFFFFVLETRVACIWSLDCIIGTTSLFQTPLDSLLSCLPRKSQILKLLKYFYFYLFSLIILYIGKNLFELMLQDYIISLLYLRH